MNQSSHNACIGWWLYNTSCSATSVFGFPCKFILKKCFPYSGGKVFSDWRAGQNACNSVNSKYLNWLALTLTLTWRQHSKRKMKNGANTTKPNILIPQSWIAFFLILNQKDSKVDLNKFELRQQGVKTNTTRDSIQCSNDSPKPIPEDLIGSYFSQVYVPEIHTNQLTIFYSSVYLCIDRASVAHKVDAAGVRWMQDDRFHVNCHDSWQTLV